MRPKLTLRAIVFGLLLMLYFGICHVEGVADQIELRFLNILILGGGLWVSLYGKALKGQHFGIKYFNGLKDGLYFSFIASFVFAMSFFLYIAAGEYAIIEQFVEKGIINESITAMHLSVFAFMEVFVSGFMMSFIMMQYLKYDWNKKSKKKSELSYQ